MLAGSTHRFPTGDCDADPTCQRLRLYDSDELDGVLQAMARQAATLLPPAQAALIGIQRRGEPLAQRLQQHLSRQDRSARTASLP